jgi:hypothetical protein
MQKQFDQLHYVIYRRTSTARPEGHNQRRIGWSFELSTVTQSVLAHVRTDAVSAALPLSRSSALSPAQEFDKNGFFLNPIEAERDSCYIQR